MDIMGGWALDREFEVFRIPIRIINPDTNLSIIRNCLFDTGFTGYLGLDKKSIEELDLKKIGSGKGFTVKGLIDFNNFEAKAEIIDNEDRTLVIIKNIDEKRIEANRIKIAVQEFEIPIMGMKLIRQINWLILSERNAIFILK